MPMKPVEVPRLGLRKLKSPSNLRILAGLKAAADANGIPAAGRFIQYGTPESPHAVVLGSAPGHVGEQDYQAAFPTTETPKE